MKPAQKRRITTALWHVANPVLRRAAGRMPWWVVLETTGRKSGLPRPTPLANGLRDDGGLWLIAVQGDHSDFVRNIRANPAVRLRHRGTWTSGTASVHDWDPARARQFNRYARSGPKVVGIDPTLIHVKLDADR